MRWDNLKSAMNCAARGRAPEYPIGCIYGNHTEGAMYKDITFAVAENRIDGHANFGISWACRDNGAGDSLGESKCSGPSLRLTKNWSQIDPTAPHFLRMMKYLRANLIEITLWDGEKAVSWLNFIKRIKAGEWYK
jgi:hypothetical protein